MQTNLFMFIFLFTLFINELFYTSFAYLYPQQIIMIQNILKDPNSSPEIILKTRECLAYHYIPLALSEFNDFTKRNNKYIRNVNKHDLRQYAILGLCDAAKSYDGSTSFYYFSKKHIIGSLHKGLTLLEPLKPQTTKQRLNGVKKPTIVWGNLNEEWVYSLNNDHEKYNNELYLEKIENVKKIVDEMEPFQKRLFYYRYCSETLREIRSVNRVSELMSISDETFWKKMKVIMEKISIQIIK